MNIHLRIYANIETLNSAKIDTLAKIGVKEIFIGIENIDNEVLSISNKSNNCNKILCTLDEIEKHGISPFLSFIFGLPGETESSMYRNHSFAKYISNRFLKMNHISFNAGIPLIGSEWFKKLSSEFYVINKYKSFTGKSLISDDNLDYELLFLLSLKLYTSVDFINVLRVLNTPLHPRLTNQVAGFGNITDNILKSKKHLDFAFELWPDMDISDIKSEFKFYIIKSINPAKFSTIAISTSQYSDQKLQKSCFFPHTPVPILDEKPI